jgi:5'-methylthioinosine phosphorylase
LCIRPSPDLLIYEEQSMLGIIGGSGLTTLANLDVHRQVRAQSVWGAPSGPLCIGRIGRQDVVFLPRHGEGHTIAPHAINYRANIDALKQVGVTRIVSVASVGGIRADLPPGSLIVPDQLIDYSWGRASSFHADAPAGQGGPVVHIDFTQPYDDAVRRALLDSGAALTQRIHDGGIYAVTQGPRLETAAEIDRLARDGAAIVGMTGMPEAALAREAGLPYAALCLVCNWAAGRGDNTLEIRFEAIEAVLAEAMGRVRGLIAQLCAG